MLLMKWASLIVVVHGLVALQEVAGSLSGEREEQLRKSYVEMDKYLSKEWKKPVEMDKGMKLIHRRAKNSWPEWRTGKYPMREASDRLDRLTKLTEDQSMCFSKGYDIVSESLRLSMGLPRLRQLVKEFVRKNGEYCEPIYGSLSEQNIDDGIDSDYHETWLNLTSRLVEQLTGWRYGDYSETLKDAIDNEANPSMNLYEFIQTKLKNPSKQVDLGQAMVDTMTQMNVSEYSRYVDTYEINRFRASEDDFTYSILRYIVKPCSHFVSKMNEYRIFQMASVHSRVLNRNLRFVKNFEVRYSSSYNLLDFYRNWIRYEICRSFILKDEQHIYRIIKQARSKVLHDDPEDNGIDSHWMPRTTVKFPRTEDYDDAGLFEANE